MLRIVLQDGGGEVTMVYPLLNLNVLVHDITAFVEVEEKGLKLSVTEGGK